MIPVCNLLIAFLCSIIAAVEFAGGEWPAALAYGGFGVGYIGLAILYFGIR